MPVSVRTADLHDAAAVAALSTELGYPLAAPEARDRLGTLLGSEGILVLVAEEGSKVLGWLQAQSCTTIETGLRVEIQGLVVSSAARRRGIGRALVGAAEAWASTLGAGVILVRTNSARVESQSFYPALGFETSKTQVVFRKKTGV
jgi:ribosomal protein S18 acetylase RimI-like enzyme